MVPMARITVVRRLPCQRRSSKGRGADPDSWNPASFSRGPSKSMFDALIIFIRRVQHYLLALALNFCPRISNCSKVSFVVLRIAY